MSETMTKEIKRNTISAGCTEEEYGIFLDQINEYPLHFSQDTIYKTDICGLFDIFLDNLPKEFRGRYNCNACHSFVKRYGNLVTINDDLTLEPVIWPEAVFPLFQKSITAMREYIIKKGKITGIFNNKDLKILGDPCTTSPSGVTYHHMSCHNIGLKFTGEENYQQAYKSMESALDGYSINTVSLALALIKSGSLYRPEKVLGYIERIENLHTPYKAEKNNKKAALLIWKYLGRPTNQNYLYIKSHMIGTLLDDIENGIPTARVISRFNELMDPLKYNRPTAAPSEGAINEAEKLFKNYGITKESLTRRYATVDDLKLVWKPKEDDFSKYMNKPESDGGIFDVLKKDTSKKAAPEFTVDRGKMTWVKYLKDILPHAKSIRCDTSVSGDCAVIFTTAEYPDSKPIFKWDKEDDRYPVARFIRSNQNALLSLSRFNIRYKLNNVIGICYDMEYHDKTIEDMSSTSAVNFIIEGASDFGSKGTAIFPECLIPELYAARSTIAAYSNTDNFVEHDEPQAVGIRLQRGLDYGDRLTLITETADMGTIKCSIDRFD